MPVGCTKWINFNSKDEARVSITVPGYDKTATIWFKSFKQGREAFQGFEGRLIVFDEEPPRDVFEEASMRQGKEPVRILFSMTPLKGVTWVKKDLVDGGLEGRNVKVFELDTLDNPHLSDEARRRLLSSFAGMSEAKRAARRFGRFVTLEGLVWPGFSRQHNVIAPFDIPKDWPRYRVMDLGTRSPTAVLWAALSPDDQLVCYREYYQSERTMGYHAQRIRELEGWRQVTEADEARWADPDEEEQAPDVIKHSNGRRWWADENTERIRNAWIDPSRPQSRLDLHIEHGLFHAPANKNVAAGIDAVASRLARATLEVGPCVCESGCKVCGETGEVTTVYGPPGVVFFDTLREFIQEIESYAWQPGTQGKDPADRVIKLNDHLCDCLRYLCQKARLMRMEM